MAVTFRPSMIPGFGAYEQETARRMAAALKKSELHLKVAYNPEEQRFTILNSKKVSSQFIQKILSSQAYYKYHPIVDLEIDRQGNKLVVFEAISPFEEALNTVVDTVNFVVDPQIAELIDNQIPFLVAIASRVNRQGTDH